MEATSIENDVAKLIQDTEDSLREAFAKIDAIAMHNQRKVLDAFREHRLTEEYFAERTGYGIDDPARAVLDGIFASVFGAEQAAVRMQMVSGTHALACALLGNLHAGQRMVSLTGAPYDTLKEVIGIEGDDKRGSLIGSGVKYVETEIAFADKSEYAAKLANVGAADMFYLQKSCGYSFARKTMSCAQLGDVIAAVKTAYPNSIVMVDNCYGEFVEATEPTDHGADLIAGSLIKNPGGGLAITGGYVAGRSDLVEAALKRLTAPGIGGHLGITFNQTRLVLQGLFLAPSVVSQAVKGSLLAAGLMERLGFKVNPSSKDKRYDIIQAIELEKRDRLINFCRALQRWSPVNAHVSPEPTQMPGYQDEVVMAGGTFVEGSTIELSADGPLRPPFAVFLQGGLSYLHVKCALEGAIRLSRSGEMPFE